MQRRRFMLAAAVAAGTAATLGAGISQWTPGWQSGAFSEPARTVLLAVARSVLKGLWPDEAGAAAPVAAAHLAQLTGVVAQLPNTTQSEVSDLLALLSLAPGRLALAGLSPPWADASITQIDAALRSMRQSRLTPRMQAYQALRELTVAAHFSRPSSWSALGYPGPRPL